MILRDCTTNTNGFNMIKEIASRNWDILAMKMREDYDCLWSDNFDRHNVPTGTGLWVVVAIRDSGVRPEPGVCDIL